MNLITSYNQNPEIQEAFRRIPKELHKRLYCDWIIGADPIRTGLHNFDTTDDGRSLRVTAHVAFPRHQTCAHKITTVVLPAHVGVYTIIHELGHVLDCQLGFCHNMIPVTKYAQTNRLEAFAEAFTTWVCPEYLPWGGRVSAEDSAVFEMLLKSRLP